MIIVALLKAAWMAGCLLSALFVGVAIYREIDAEHYRRSYMRRQPRLPPRWLWMLAFGLLLISVSGPLFLENTYYNHFLFELLLVPFLITAATGFLAASAVSPHLLERVEFWPVRVLLRLGLLGAAAMLLWSCLSGGPGMLTAKVHALQQGPQRVSGILEEKLKVPQGRGMRYSIKVDGDEYQVHDRDWWDALRQGEQFEHVRDPGRTAAFRPHQVALTPRGALVAACCLGLWTIVGVSPLWWLKR